MLGVFPNSILDGIDKGLKFTQALVKESLEFFPPNGDLNLIFHLLLLLLPAKQVSIFTESNSKRYPILTFDLTSSKMVFTLLEKVIAFQVSFIPIYIWETGF